MSCRFVTLITALSSCLIAVRCTSFKLKERSFQLKESLPSTVMESSFNRNDVFIQVVGTFPRRFFSPFKSLFYLLFLPFGFSFMQFSLS